MVIRANGAHMSLWESSQCIWLKLVTGEFTTLGWALRNQGWKTMKTPFRKGGSRHLSPVRCLKPLHTWPCLLLPALRLHGSRGRGVRSSFVLLTRIVFRVVKELDAPAQSDFATWTRSAPIVKTYVGDARTNGCPVIALSASNTSFSPSRTCSC